MNATAVNHIDALWKSLAKAGVDSREAALLIAPAGYHDYRQPSTILPVANQGSESYVLVACISIVFMTQGGRPVDRESMEAARVFVRASDSAGAEADFHCYGDMANWRTVMPGDDIFVAGVLRSSHGRASMVNPSFIAADARGGVRPFYRGKQGVLGGDKIRSAVHSVGPDGIPGAVALLSQRTGMDVDAIRATIDMPAESLIRQLHWPDSLADATQSLAAARALSLAAIAWKVGANRERTNQPKSRIVLTVERLAELIKMVPYPMTKDQRRAVKHIMDDLSSNLAMARLLSGDVGTGKTAVYLVIAAAASEVGARVAIVCPSRPLAAQVHSECVAFFPHIKAVCMIAGAKPKDVDDALVIGTTAIISWAKKGDRAFDLVIVDEQQKFSTAQRAALVGPSTNLLEVTATAIPRTVALVGLAGMDVSELREVPVTKLVRTRLVEREKAQHLSAFVKDLIAKGGQAALIYPLVDGDDDQASGTSAFRRFPAHFSDRVGFVHGRMKDEEKDEVLKRMREKEIDLLVSTTLIEVGVTLPSLVCMVVVHPERFGVTQLHQLRGRLARTGGKGYFFMLLDGELKQASLDRLRLLEECADGFSLAVRDAAMRGPGDVFHDLGAQSGATRSLFMGIELTYADLEHAALRALAFEAESRIAVQGEQ